MLSARFIAVVLLLQGVGPAFLFGVWRSGGWFLACLAGVYAFMAAGFWQGRRWAMPLAFVLTLPQLLAFSSSWFSWRFYALASYGFGLAPAPTLGQTPAFGYHFLGGCLNLTLGYNQQLVADYADSEQHSFVLFNFVPLPILLLLLLQLRTKLVATRSSAVPDHSVQRTAG